MHPIPESELVLNSNGSVYHLNLRPEHISDTIIVVGDPDRVYQVTKYFDSIEFTIRKREFITQTGFYKGKRISVISTGIGTDNVEIVMNELDALVNIDLNTRLIKENLTRLKIVRIGTSGSIQSDIPVGSLVASVNAIGLDSLMQFYLLPQTDTEEATCKLLQQQLSLSFQPYYVSCSEELLTKLGADLIKGTTITCPGFYAPQGRQIRFSLYTNSYLETLRKFDTTDFRLSNMEMETAGYYAFGRILGHDVLSLNAILANRFNKEFSPNPEQVVDDLIQLVLSRL